MKKFLMFLSVASACLLSLSAQAANASNAGQYVSPTMNARPVGQIQGQGVEQGRTYQGNPINGGVVNDPAPAAPQGWEKDMGNGYTQCCCYKPCYSYTCECEMCPKYVQRKCYRQVPQYYQVQRCKMVPQYYNETCCRQCTEEYCVTDCVECPKYTYHRHCNWEPQYSYKCCPQPVCCPEPAPACPPACAPSCQ